MLKFLLLLLACAITSPAFSQAPLPLARREAPVSQKTADSLAADNRTQRRRNDNLSNLLADERITLGRREGLVEKFRGRAHRRGVFNVLLTATVTILAYLLAKK